jgi:hypothetical protein
MLENRLARELMRGHDRQRGQYYLEFHDNRHVAASSIFAAARSAQRVAGFRVCVPDRTTTHAPFTFLFGTTALMHNTSARQDRGTNSRGLRNRNIRLHKQKRGKLQQRND